MAETSTEIIESVIGATIVPDMDINLASLGVQAQVELSAGTAVIRVVLGFPATSIVPALSDALRERVLQQPGVDEARIHIDWKVHAHEVQGVLSPLPGVKNIVAVASGKGGVGKSTTAVNLALALAAEGARVGVLDADIYGPSQPRMLGVLGGRPGTVDGKSFEPLEAHGIQVISIGFLVDEEKPMIWRGPMVTQAVSQLAFQTNWRDLDYLIVDLPPGTGDTQLTMTQKVPLSGVVIVTTPQDIALLDARRGLKMFEKVNVRVLGVLENMSTHICTACGHEEALFGAGGGARLAKESDLPLLGQLPLDSRIQREADSGTPTVIAAPESVIAKKYRAFARRVAACLSTAPRDHKGAFPKIVVE
ncbi:MAG: iron-sulfur cluster carrier protein ApbC [Gammaproteobacteria bacterium]|nr:iron-sulfur cluster carrier protein ApbC [Gammaproteobacteria bacterium]